MKPSAIGLLAALTLVISGIKMIAQSRADTVVDGHSALAVAYFHPSAPEQKCELETVRVQLEYRQASGHVWLRLENDTDAQVELITLDSTAVWDGHERPINFPNWYREFQPRERAQFEVSHHLLRAIQEAFPALPNGERIELRMRPVMEPDSAAATAVFEVLLNDGRLSLLPV